MQFFRAWESRDCLLQFAGMSALGHSRRFRHLLATIVVVEPKLKSLLIDAIFQGVGIARLPTPICWHVRFGSFASVSASPGDNSCCRAEAEIALNRCNFSGRGNRAIAYSNLLACPLWVIRVGFGISG